jgi:hypothetical protein
MAEQAISTMYVNIIPSMKGFNQSLTGELTSSGANAGTTSGSAIATNMKKSVLGGLGGIGAAVGGAFAIGSIVNFTQSMIKAGEEEVQGNRRLEALVANNNAFAGSSKEVSKRILEQTGKLSVLNGLDDDSIKLTQAKLLAFGDVAKSAGTVGGVFDRATQSAIDLAASGFGSAEDNAVKLGKALQDPKQYMDALARSGVVLTDEQKNLVIAMQDAGDMTGAQSALLDILEGKYGGVAAATAPASAKLAAAWDNVTDAIGTALLPTVDEVTKILINDVIPAITSFIDEFKKGNTPLNDFLNILKDMIDYVVTNWDWLSKLALAIGGVALAIGIANVILGIYETVVGISTLATLAFNAAWLANPIVLVVLGIIAAIVLVVAAIWLIASNWDAIVAWVSAGIKTLGDFFGTVFGAIGEWWNGVINGIVVGFQNAVGWISGLLNNLGSFFSAVWNGIGEGFRGTVNWIIGLFEGMLNFIINGINTFLSLLNGGLGAIKDLTGIDLKIGMLSTVALPRLAKGGFVNQPTTAIIGEAGPEVVTPLKDFERMMGIGDTKNNGQTIVYNNYANPGMTSEQLLIEGMKRAKLQGAV